MCEYSSVSYESADTCEAVLREILNFNKLYTATNVCSLVVLQWGAARVTHRVYTTGWRCVRTLRCKWRCSTRWHLSLIRYTSRVSRLCSSEFGFVARFDTQRHHNVHFKLMSSYHHHQLMSFQYWWFFRRRYKEYLNLAIFIETIYFCQTSKFLT